MGKWGCSCALSVLQGSCPAEPWVPSLALASPAELPDAHGIARGGVQHGARGAECDLVDLMFSLGTGDGT